MKAIDFAMRLIKHSKSNIKHSKFTMHPLYRLTTGGKAYLTNFFNFKQH